MSITTNPTRNPPIAALGGDKHGEILLTPKEAASFLKVSPSFLAKKRMHGDGPRYRKLSRAVRYLKSDLLDWLKACAKTSTSEGHVR